MESASATAKPAYPITSVDNALRLLLLFRERQSIRVAEASDELGVVRSTAHRLLAMLQYHELVRQDPATKAYLAGPALWDIGLSVVRNLDLVGQLRPVLEELAAQTRETAHLVLLQGRVVRCVDGVESPQAVKTSARIGETWLPHASAAGKALLAELTEDRLRALLGEGPWERPTEKAAGSLAELAPELERVRRNGYATSFGEDEADIASVAVAQRNGAGVVTSALAVSAPATRLNRRNASDLAAVLTEKAAAAAALLG
ncbi:Pectin degradation repressor protein KdgR [Baekduia alba]|uniref:IclR family transcriptional regulator n=1 Tax=Baekduia alba TaxID=2997333 RepID=UPI00233FBCEC|nr:IclR family transcriptional regulator [Baekduia alba]WCB95277.1 Pectin degradation repressor protein KdgR [Baekduia alba]